MSDRFDPKPSARPTGGRSGPGGAADDPLAELARIVSGRSPFDTAPAKTERHAGAAPTGSPNAPLPSEAELARDLEAELLNELQASFSTIPDIVGRPEPTVSPAPPPSPPPAPVAFQPAPPQAIVPRPKAPSPAQPLPVPPPMDVLEELGIPADMLFRPPQAPDDDLPRAPQMVPMPPTAQPRAERTGQPAKAAPPQAPQPAKWQSLASRISRPAPTDDAGAAASVPQRAEPTRMPAPAVRQPVRPPQSARPEPSAGQFRPTLAPNGTPTDAGATQRAPSTRWDPPSDQYGQSMPDLSRFAPVRNEAAAADPRQKRPAAPQDEQDFVDEFPFAGELPDAAEAAAQSPELMPGYGDDDQVPYPEDDFAAYERRRSPFQSPFLIAAVLGIVAIGGAAAIVFRPDSAPETPPIIAADATPTKVAPDNTASGDGDSQAKRIYDRVDPGSEVADSRLVVPDQDPIADIPPIPSAGAGDSPVSRVILEGGPGFEAPADEPGANDPMDLSRGGTSTMQSAPEPESIGPKKVRTVVVRPDGTIVSSAASDDGNAPALPEIPPASETPPAPAADENPLLADNFPTGDEPASPAPAAQPNVPPPPASASIPDIPAPRPAAPAAPAPTQRVQAPPPPTVVATTGAGTGPLDMTPPSAGAAVAGGSGGGFLVQVSSQRSEETAVSTFRQLQRRYPNILGDRAPDIQRADLGDRGVYFRVRVGYPTRDAAIEMCENLKAAGGDCILATR